MEILQEVSKMIVTEYTYKCLTKDIAMLCLPNHLSITQIITILRGNLK